MFKPAPGVKKRNAGSFFSFVLFAALCTLLYDFGRFVGVAKEYGQKARDFRHASLPTLPNAHEAIVVLTGDQHRIPRALWLLRHRASPLLIISGTGRGATLTDLINQQGAATLDIHSVWNKIVLESRSGSTIENAQESGKILQARGVNEVVLVTSEYHMLRAIRVFRQVLPKINFIPYPVASSFSELSFYPPKVTADAIFKLWFEYWKYFVYRAYASRHLPPSQK